MNVEPVVKNAALTAVNEVMDQVKGARAAVVSTEDGFEVASRIENTTEIARLSALASSMAALGAIVGEEGRLGACQKVIIEAAGGHIVMVQAQRADISLVLSVVAGQDAIMGQILYFATQATRALEQA
ncbi:MAG: roadblock/LC7 domain-containing protein [Polaromonas sp.]|nr:roadblock/LC7 domain-containing protein [Polaromonas sp.]